MNILEVKNLSKIYGIGATAVKALDDVSFSVENGEFIAIVGASGSGKSTLLHILGGVDRPTSGSVIVDNQEIHKLSDKNLAVFRRREIGLIYQFYNLIPVLDVIENITLPIQLDGKMVDKNYLNELVENLKLEDRKKHLPNELSGGQQQRVSIGRALINRPSLLLADEPTGNLDSVASEEIMGLLSESNRIYKQTIIMITHDRNLANYAQRIITITDGKIASDIINKDRI
ncbi:MAG: ABC transporter ATP-binding protein [Erysipelothrix sp.]|nr:ABC transporter ATP-binding protein [Erysipelothrix sp.]